jgi:hypothetical protein
MSNDAAIALPDSVHPSATGRATTRRGLRRGVVAALTALIAVGALAAGPPPAAAGNADVKVAIVVGPVGSLTSKYISHARGYASLARSYGAEVVEVYSPRATWSRVRSAVQGANLLVYLGHGNGYPNPYSSSLNPYKVDGFGLNPSTTSGNTKTRYYGEYYVRTAIKLAPNAVVLLNHLCYSAGSSEPGRANPSLRTAKKRVDNFGAGFLRTGAKVVFAETLGNASYVIRGLFASNKSMAAIFWSAPNKTGTYRSYFNSARTSGRKGILDPRKPGQYYRSIVGSLTMTAADWRP